LMLRGGIGFLNVFRFSTFCLDIDNAIQVLKGVDTGGLVRVSVNSRQGGDAVPKVKELGPIDGSQLSRH
jgi:hypothetical protein